MPTPRIPQFTLVERRRAPRYQVDIACEATTAEGEIAQGRIINLSLTGMRIEGNTQFIHTLYPNFKRSNWRTPLKIKVAMLLPISQDEGVEIDLHCQLVYCNRAASDTYMVGCQYLDIQAQAQQALLSHIRYFGIPNEP